jgi:hypothetical protein
MEDVVGGLVDCRPYVEPRRLHEALDRTEAIVLGSRMRRSETVRHFEKLPPGKELPRMRRVFATACSLECWLPARHGGHSTPGSGSRVAGGTGAIAARIRHRPQE